MGFKLALIEVLLVTSINANLFIGAYSNGVSYKSGGGSSSYSG
jgi:hypothetical protein